jgi:CubicO group peptidase (beta-lactamase class C family)
MLVTAVGGLLSAGRDPRREVTPIPFSTHPAISVDRSNAELDRFIRDQMRRTKVPGLSVAVVHAGKLAWAKGYGVANSFTGRLVNTDTPFEAASIGKCLTGYAALILVEKGGLDLKRPLSSYLNEQFISDGQYREQITATTVLTHTSGLSNNLMESHHGVAFEPGSRFSYSGVGFMYIQQVIEAITRRPFGEFMSAMIFAPLDMRSSSYLRVSSGPPMSRGHYHIGRLAVAMPFFPAVPPNAANLLCSTAPDLARFVCELMNPRLLSPSMVDKMLSPHVHTGGDVWWGLGIGLYKGTSECFWHWGDNLDFESYLIGCPKEKIGAVVMTNSSRGLDLARKIAAKALARAPRTSN